MNSKIRFRSIVLTVLTALAVTAVRVAAQQSEGSSLMFRPIAGAFLPTGAHRDLLKKSVLVGGQVAWGLGQNVAITSSFAWAPSKDLTMPQTASRGLKGTNATVDVFQYDLGLEARLPIISGGMRVTPYVGGGVGGRSYNYRKLDLESQTNISGYGAVGLDVAPAAGPIGIRFEARNNVSLFKGLSGEYARGTRRNDVTVAAGLTWRL